MESMSLERLPEIAATLKKALLTGNRIFLFSGDVGSGKTTLIQELARLLGVNGAVQSPTFGIVHAYSSEEGTIQHSDWYRLNSVQELWEMGIHEALESDIWFIEWPEIGMALLQEFSFVHVHIATPENIDQLNRSYTIAYHEAH